MRKKSEQQRTAYHEAGHAVVTRVLGRTVNSVTIIPDKDFLGQCSFASRWKAENIEWEVKRRTRHQIETRVMILLGGYIAEKKFAGRVTKGHEWDFEKATNWLSYASGSDQELNAYLGWLYARTENILHLPAYWRAVELIADQLLLDRTLRNPRVKELVQTAGPRILAESKIPSGK